MTDPAQVQEHLQGVTYPASKQELIDYAEEHEAPDEIIGALRMLPERNFSGPSEVSAAVGAVD